VDAEARDGAGLSLRVLLLADDPLARGGLAALLGGQGITVVGQSAPRERVLEAEADAVVVDLGMTPAERMLAFDRLGAPVLVLVPDEAHAADVLAAGARAVLVRDADGPRLVAALRAIVRGLVVLDDALLDTLRPRVASWEAPAEALTPRELEVLQLLSEGLANRRIAERLGIGERTVKFHVNAILGKLGVGSRTEAVVVAARLGLVTL
jgi:DNA-binding NarL/FixJ family response regulator